MPAEDGRYLAGCPDEQVRAVATLAADGSIVPSARMGDYVILTGGDARFSIDPQGVVARIDEGRTAPREGDR